MWRRSAVSFDHAARVAEAVYLAPIDARAYAHPLFWAPYSIIGDGGARQICMFDIGKE